MSSTAIIGTCEVCGGHGTVHKIRRGTWACIDLFRCARNRAENGRGGKP